MPSQFEVALRVSAGPDGPIRPVVLAGASVPIVITAMVQDVARVASGLELRILRPDGIVLTFAERDLRRVTAQQWRLLVCMDLPGPYEISASCRLPSPARAVLSLRAQAVPGDAIHAPPGPLWLARNGLAWITQDGRPRTQSTRQIA